MNDIYKRDAAIDYMRAGALLLLILAHVNTPKLINESRCFDVVMMVFLSGYCYHLSSAQRRTYRSYLTGRFRKLLIPSWEWLTGIFAVLFLTNTIHEPVPLIKVIESYLLYDGIGYVWFVRVTLILALVSPILQTVSERIGSSGVLTIFAVLFMTVVYEGLIILYNARILSHWPNLFLYLYPIYLFGYGIIYFIGIHYTRLNKRQRVILLLILLLLFGASCYAKGFEISANKYPPRVLYISYGLIWTIIVFEFLSMININNYEIPKSVEWLSKNSFTIYLAHMVPVVFLKYFDNNITSIIKLNFLIEYVFVITITGLLVVAASACKQFLLIQK